MADKKNGKGGKKSSADDIIEALAQEMGVDEDADAEDTDVRAAPEEPAAEREEKTEPNKVMPVAEDERPAPKKAKKPAVEEDEEEERPAPKKAKKPAVEEDEEEERPAPKKAKKPAVEEDEEEERPAPKKAKKPAVEEDEEGERPASKKAKKPAHHVKFEATPGAGDYHDVSNGQALEELFTVGPKESPSGDPTHSPYWDPDIDEAPRRWSSSPKLFLGSLAGCIVAMSVAFAMLPAELKADARALLSGRDIIEERQLREAARLEAERQEMLRNAPKYGTVEIITVPNNLFVSAMGQPTMIFPQGRTDLTVPTRSKVIFADVSVTEPFRFTISGAGNFADRDITIAPFGDPESPWYQDFTGVYSCSQTYQMELLPDRALELDWRMRYRPNPDLAEEPLHGTISVTSEPSGALIAYNGVQLLDTEGNPIRTPATFSTYPAPAAAPDQTPRPVNLSREGMRLELMLDGYVRTAWGVYVHEYQCAPREGAVPPDPTIANPDWRAYCDYRYSAEISLQTPPAPGSGDAAGSGQAPSGTGTQP